LIRNFSHGLRSLSLASVTALSLAGTLALSTASFAEDAPAAPTGVQTSGVLIGYYQYQFENPDDTDILPGFRAFDVRHNTPTLNLAELNAWKAAQPGGFGWKATIAAGDTMDIMHGGIGVSGHEARFKNIPQLYGTYAFNGGGGIDFGKFYTPFGYEVTENNANYNFSNSLPFFLLPFYHAGVRISTPNMKGFTATAYVVNALYNSAQAGVNDDNDNPAFIGQLNYTDPAGKFVVIESLGGGKDKFNLAAGATANNNKNFVSDTDFIYNVNPTTLFGLNYTYAKTDPQDIPVDDDDTQTGSVHALASTVVATDKITANGYAVYFKKQLTPKNAAALRFSAFDAKSSAGGENLKPWEVTATYEMKLSPTFTTRIEYRHDAVNKDNGPGILFADQDGMASKSSQDTITIAGMFTFQ
jgi:hypothetical protein